VHQVIVRHNLLEIERIEQLPLILADPPHHPPAPADVRIRKTGITVRRPFQMTFATKSANSGSVQHARLAGIQRYEGREIGRAVACE
jgi:hypothetical protein